MLCIREKKSFSSKNHENYCQNFVDFENSIGNVVDVALIFFFFK